MSSLLQDLRYAWRTLAHSPGFTVVALLTLALGIGANTAIFSFVDGLLLRPLPYKDADRIVRVLEKPPQGERNGISTLNFLDWQKDNAVFDFMAAQSGGSVTLTGRQDPVQLRGARVSARFFDIFGIRAALGRTFLPDEDQRGKDKVVVLSNAVWVSQFGADRSIVGRTVLLDRRAVHRRWRTAGRWRLRSRVRAGVAAPGLRAIEHDPQLSLAGLVRPAQGRRVAPAGQGKHGRDRGTHRERLSAVEQELGSHRRAVCATHSSGLSFAPALLVLLTATGLVLLIGCANLANLSLARGVSREREVAVRASLGAGRGRLVRQFLTETVLLSLCGGVLGIGIGYGLMSWLQTLIPPFSFAREAEIAMDTRVLAFSLAISVFTGVLFGLAPAWQATTPDLAGTMKEGGRGSSGGSRKILRDALIVAEVALAFVLLVGSGLMMRSFFTLMNAEMGFDGSNVLTMTLPIARERFPDPDRLNLYLREMMTAVEAVPGVRETAYSCAPPMRGTCYGMPWQVADRPLENKANRQGGFFKIVSASYFSTFRLQLLNGRGLSDRDVKSSPRVLVINERLAKRDFKDANPVGRRLLIEEIIPGKTELGPDIAWEIVGVIRDEKVNGMDDDRSAGVYVSNEQSPAYGGTLSVRGSTNPATLLKSITAAIRSVDKDQAITDIRTVDDIKELSVAPNRIQSTLLGIFGTVALLLAAIGIYGVISYSVAQRTHEIGIRAALGATNAALMRLILIRGLVLTSAGLIIGLAGALGLTRLMTVILYKVGARDPGTMIAVAFILAAVAAAACYVPARRATRVDPLVALRYE